MVLTRCRVVERRVVTPPRETVREVVVKRPVAYWPHSVVHKLVAEREGFYCLDCFGPRPVGYGPAFNPYD